MLNLDYISVLSWPLVSGITMPAVPPEKAGLGSIAGCRLSGDHHHQGEGLMEQIASSLVLCASLNEGQHRSNCSAGNNCSFVRHVLFGTMLECT